MPLPILRGPDDPADLIRLFHRTERYYFSSIAQETELDVATAYTNPALPLVHDANHVREAALPQGVSPEQAMARVAEHFAGQGVRCWYWVTAASQPAERTAPMVQRLVAQGYSGDVDCDILLLRHMRPVAGPDLPDVKVIPARASFRHARQLAEEAASRYPDAAPQLAEKEMLLLDNPHWDVLLAMKDGRAIGQVGLLTVGDVGRIEDVYVSKAHRGQGVGRLLMGRALDLCARAMFRRIFTTVAPDNAPAVRLYGGLGFEKVGQSVHYRVPGPL